MFYACQKNKKTTVNKIMAKSIILNDPFMSVVCTNDSVTMTVDQ